MALREILAAFGVEVDDKKLKGFDSTIETVAGKLKGLAVFLAGGSLALGFKSLIAGQIEAGSRLNDTATKLGLATSELERFQYAAQQNGADTGEATMGLQFLNKALGHAAEGNAEAAGAFQKMGISVKDAAGKVRPVGDVVLDVADGLAKLDSAGEKTAAAMLFFGRGGAALLPTLGEGSAAVKKLYERFEKLGGALSKEFIEAADDAGDKLDDFHFAVTRLKAALVTKFLPYVTKGAETLAFMTAHLSRLAKQLNFARIAAVTLGAGGFVLLAAKALKFASAVNVVLPTLRTLGSGLSAIFTGGWIALALVGFAAIVLILEDLWTAANGGQSALKGLLTTAFGTDEATRILGDFKKAFDELKPVIVELLPLLKSVGKDLADGFIAAIPFIAKALAMVIKLASGATQTLAAGFKAAAAASEGDWNKAGRVIDDVGNRVFGRGGAFEGLFDTDARKFTTPNGHLVYEGSEQHAAAIALGTPLQEVVSTRKGVAEGGGPSIDKFLVSPNQSRFVGPPNPNEISQEINTTITIQEARDAQEIADKVGQAVFDVGKQARDALAGFGRGR